MVALQQIGGTGKKEVDQLLKAGATLIPISIYTPSRLDLLMDGSSAADLQSAPDTAWVNFQRQDDVSATAYFYLDRPENGLPSLMDVAERTVGLADTEVKGSTA